MAEEEFRREENELVNQQDIEFEEALKLDQEKEQQKIEAEEMKVMILGTFNSLSAAFDIFIDKRRRGSSEKGEDRIGKIG